MAPRATWKGLLVSLCLVSACAHPIPPPPLPSISAQLQDGQYVTITTNTLPELRAYYYNPQPDITTYELARLLPWIVGVHACLDQLYLSDAHVVLLGPLVRHLSKEKCL